MGSCYYGHPKKQDMGNMGAHIAHMGGYGQKRRPYPPISRPYCPYFLVPIWAFHLWREVMLCACDFLIVDTSFFFVFSDDRAREVHNTSVNFSFL